MKNISALMIICVWLVPLLSVASEQSLKVITAANLEYLQKKVDDGITLFEQTNKQHWSYKVTRYENEEGDITSSTERYSPSHSIATSWKLLEKNGEQPSQKQLNAFFKNKRKLAKKENVQGSMSVPLRDMIDISSLAIVSENKQYLELQFNVNLKQFDDDSLKKLTGHLQYNKKQAFIEKIIIVNQEPFSPVFSANISDFEISFSFIRLNNSILAHQQRMTMKGTFAIFTDIDEVSIDSYTDYKQHIF